MSKDSSTARGELAGKLVGFATRKGSKSGRLITSKIGDQKGTWTGFLTQTETP